MDPTLRLDGLIVCDDWLRLEEQYQAALDQLERATKFIAKQGMEYRFAEFCGGVANPASTQEAS